MFRKTLHLLLQPLHLAVHAPQCLAQFFDLAFHLVVLFEGLVVHALCVAAALFRSAIGLRATGALSTWVLGLIPPLFVRKPLGLLHRLTSHPLEPGGVEVLGGDTQVTDLSDRAGLTRAAFLSVHVAAIVATILVLTGSHLSLTLPAGSGIAMVAHFSDLPRAARIGAVQAAVVGPPGHPHGGWRWLIVSVVACLIPVRMAGGE